MKKLLFSCLLALSIIFQTLPNIIVHAESNLDDAVTTVIAASDFQPKSGVEDGKMYMRSIFSAMEKDGITEADGFLCCGDYDYATQGSVDATMAGISAVKEVASEIVPAENIVLVQGNHDAAVGINKTGKNDPVSGDYGVFVINEDDYMWYNNDETRIKNVAQSLVDYLNGKLAIAYKKPIFIVSHLPLHFTGRTVLEGDGQHANYIFDVLNEAGEMGLNIFFLFGHNHSNGWDEYLGGSMLYLEKGDEILIPQNSREQADCQKETLSFTYLNAGYLGYYGTNIDDELTMTVFTIQEDEVVIARYNKYGMTTLKKEGKGKEANIEVYPSPQSASLTVPEIEPTFLKDVVVTQKTGDCYIQINDVDELESGKEYLLVYGENIMLPSVVTKTNSSNSARKGFDLEHHSGLGASVIYGAYEEKMWTFVKSGDNWLVGNEEGNMKLTSTEEYSIAATLEENGDLFAISGWDGVFTFSNGTYVLNYNNRGLINGFATGPAGFYIYRAENSISVVGGIATVEDVSMASAQEGDTVRITAEKAPYGKSFDKWTIIRGDVVLADENSASTTFIMPSGSVEISVTYKHAHTYDRMIVAEEYLKEDTTDIYYMSCPCGKSSEDESNAKTFLLYCVTEGKNQLWTSGDSQGLIFTINGGTDGLCEIQIDSEPIAQSCYTLLDGGRVQLNVEYLQTLGDGVHTIGFFYTNGGGVSILFEVDAPNNTIAQEVGCSSSLYNMQGIYAITILIGIIVLVKRREEMAK